MCCGLSHAFTNNYNYFPHFLSLSLTEPWCTFVWFFLPARINCRLNFFLLLYSSGMEKSLTTYEECCVHFNRWNLKIIMIFKSLNFLFVHIKTTRYIAATKLSIVDCNNLVVKCMCCKMINIYRKSSYINVVMLPRESFCRMTLHHHKKNKKNVMAFSSFFLADWLTRRFMKVEFIECWDLASSSSFCCVHCAPDLFFWMGAKLTYKFFIFPKHLKIRKSTPPFAFA